MSRTRLSFGMTVALLAGAAGAVSPTGGFAQPEGPEVVFEDPSLDARTKELLARYAHQVRPWGMIQRVAEEVIAANEEEISTEEIAARNGSWLEGRGDDLEAAILESGCSQALQTLLAANAGYAEAFALDRRGRVVCMSRRPDRYAFDGVPGWDEAVREGNLWIARAGTADGASLERLRLVVPVLYRGEVVGGMVVEKLVPRT